MQENQMALMFLLMLIIVVVAFLMFPKKKAKKEVCGWLPGQVKYFVQDLQSNLESKKFCAGDKQKLQAMAVCLINKLTDKFTPEEFFQALLDGRQPANETLTQAVVSECAGKTSCPIPN